MHQPGSSQTSYSSQTTQHRTSRIAPSRACGVVLAVFATFTGGCPDPCQPPRARINGVCYSPCPRSPGYCDDDGGPLDGSRDVNTPDAMDALDVTGATDESRLDVMVASEDARFAPDVVDPADARTTCEACDPPRQISPLSSSRVTSQRPTLRWSLPTGVDGASLDLCRDRAMTIECQRLEARGSSARPSAPLRAGLWFWRLRARVGDATGTRSSPVWQFSCGTRSPADTSWGSALDVDGDGFADGCIGAPSGARTHVFHGTAAGVSTTPTRSIPSATGPFESVLSAGDVNGDGFSDVATITLTTLSLSRRIDVYFGSATGAGLAPAVTLDATAGAIRGAVLFAGGDINGDGYADLALAQRVGGSADQIQLAYGSEAGPSDRRLATVDISAVAVANAGDVNGDGFSDAIAVGGSAGAFRVSIYLGSTVGLATSPALTLTGMPADVGFGQRVAGVGDVTGDGLSDFAVAAPGYQGGQGRVYLYAGSATGPSPTPLAVLDSPGGVAGAFGTTVASAGDLNGDGFDDLAIGAPDTPSFAAPTEMAVGAVHVYLGGVTIATSPVATLMGADGPGARFGDALSGGGDVNRDGRADLLVGAPFAMSGNGRAYLFVGSPTGVVRTPAAALASPDAGAVYFGRSVALGW